MCKTFRVVQFSEVPNPCIHSHFIYGVPFAGYEMGVGFGTISGIPFARVPKNGRTLAEDILWCTLCGACGGRRPKDCYWNTICERSQMSEHL